MTLTLDILDRLIGFDTVSANSNLALIDYAEDFLKQRGFTVQRILDPTGQKAGLHAHLGPGGAGVLLSGHTDVVPAEGQPWTRDPFRMGVEDGRAYGRGATDMKGFVAAALSAADRAAKAPLKAPLGLVLSYDEEVGCLGIRHMLTKIADQLGAPRICIVGEPTEMQVVVGHKGKAAFTAQFEGEAGHSSLAPRFTNALHMAGAFMSALQKMQADLSAQGARDNAYDVPFTTVHVGQLSGGRALNIVPDRAEMRFEYRHLPADTPERMSARVYAAAREVEAVYRKDCPAARIRITEDFAYPGLEVAPDADVAVLARGLSGIDAVTKVAYGTEAGQFDRLGIPSIVCGPGSMDGQGHKPDEFVTLEQLAACDAMLSRTIAAIC